MLIEDISTAMARQSDKPVMSLSAYSVQGKRLHMEDYFDIGYQMKPCDQRRPNEWPYEYFYFGIFDGHGGKEAASFAKRNLLKLITKQKDFWSNDDEDVKRAIRSGFAETHAAMRKEMPTWSRTSRILPSTAGTTASVLFIRNGKFYTGHVGDSRIVIAKENAETKHWIADQVTEDHKPESKEETARIQRAGGEVRSKIGVHRVVWRRPVLNSDMETKLIYGPKSAEYDNYMKLVSFYPVQESLVNSYQTIPFLAIARSLGDFWSLNPYSGQYVVSPEPDVTCRPIEADDKCILLATDGLWNVVHSSLAIRMLQELNISKNGRRQYYEDDYFTIDNFYDVAGDHSENHAQSLVYLAYQMWERRSLRSDNITVVVAMLHDILASFKKCDKVHVTRASTLPIRNPNQNVENKLVQLDETKSFDERIRLDKEPMFLLPDSHIFDDLWYKLEDLLIFPPTLIKNDYELQDLGIIHPKNYDRLSEATCTKITRFDEYPEDSFIYIKRVSDDPADEHKLPTRTNKSGKEVRDSSAQATQCIHDFGQPWDQLLDNPREDEDDPLAMYILDLESDEKLRADEEMDKARRLEKTEEDLDEILNEHLEVECNVRDVPKDKKSIPQLRCLLNHTPPLRRSTRTSNQSLSDNTKRKANLTTSLSKPKRRKSQPVRLNLTRI